MTEKKGETMDFEEIDELNEEDMNALYNDIVEFGDDAHLAGCCCDSGGQLVKNHNKWYQSSCNEWCRGIGLTCSRWDDYAAFSCFFFSC